ncbi:hypothetical protein MAP00_006922 [Monascus purpureus]|nr:hypothetical protein MAP00_006922 [Monascus purpureus]
MFPTYPIVLTFKYDSSEVVDFLARNNDSSRSPFSSPKLDWARAVDGRRRLRIYRQLPTSSADKRLSSSPSWEVRSRILGVYDKGPGKGTVMELEHSIVDSVTGEVYTRSWETAFFLRTGGWGGERGPQMEHFPVPTSREHVMESFQTTGETAHLYRLNGDYNPLHASPDVGKALGYGDIIIHGLFSWNVVAQVVLRHYGEKRKDGKSYLLSFEARFASPVKPGDKLDISLWDMGLWGNEQLLEWNQQQQKEKVKIGGKIREIRFLVKVGDRIVLSDGRALLEELGTKQSLL